VRGTATQIATTVAAAVNGTTQLNQRLGLRGCATGALLASTAISLPTIARHRGHAAACDWASSSAEPVRPPSAHAATVSPSRHACVMPASGALNVRLSSRSSAASRSFEAFTDTSSQLERSRGRFLAVLRVRKQIREIKGPGILSDGPETSFDFELGQASLGTQEADHMLLHHLPRSGELAGRACLMFSEYSTRVGECQFLGIVTSQAETVARGQAGKGVL
jgi:hypothetical protein